MNVTRAVVFEELCLIRQVRSRRRPHGALPRARSMGKSLSRTNEIVAAQARWAVARKRDDADVTVIINWLRTIRFPLAR